ncbi:LysR family transcriptional regulator [Pseudonocardia cypriaca]|uniref:LysR family transcriptional regulator n=1 Tax=Pseudonocardia cypriaca TaxID=882449 RepID=UPI0011537ADB|nr:LysR family transcriptional regulator [Pseudonocardia cypriaca]
MDLAAVRTFVAAADAGQFQEAAAVLSITQQAVSKRIAALERDLEVRLFVRTARGAQLTIDGQAFLPHARELLRAEERADASVRPGRRALRVDVVSRRVASAARVQEFYRAHPEIELDVVALNADVETAIAAVEAGTIDATFHAVPVPVPATITFVGEGSRYMWPDRYDLRRIPVRDPAPIYPMSLIWRADNPHPALAALRDHLASRRVGAPDTEVWLPKWTHRPARST